MREPPMSKRSPSPGLWRNSLLHLVGGEELKLHLWRSCILCSPPQFLSGGPCQFAIACPQAVEVFFCQLFDIQQPIVGSLDGTDHFIQFQLDRFTIAVLRI
jgi:hypothetical protein